MIIMILGMHRSGTSTVAGVLHMNNIVMGTYENFWPRPLSQNPKGFYENFDFRMINDQILKMSGYDVKSYNPDIPMVELNNKLLSKMKKLIEHANSSFPDWGWKDPRTCLTASSWVDAINLLGLGDELKIVFLTRKASSVSRSLYKRNGLPFEKGLQLWESYTDRALQFCSGSGLPIHYCSFEDLLDDPVAICNSLFTFMGRDWDSEIVGKFIDRSISTSAKGEEIKYPEHIAVLEEKVYSLVKRVK